MYGVIYLDSKINHKITQMNIVTLNFSLKRLLPSLTLFLVFSLNLMGQEGDPGNGKKLFNTNCAACHKLDKKLIGPPLKGISEKRTNEWLQAWIKDNNALRASGDQDAIDIFEEYQGMPMIAYPQLSEQDINDIIAFTDDKLVDAAVADASEVPQEVDPMVAVGKKLFQTNCAACHKLDKKLIGPALGNIADKRSE